MEYGGNTTPLSANVGSLASAAVDLLEMLLEDSSSHERARLAASSSQGVSIVNILVNVANREITTRHEEVQQVKARQLLARLERD